MGACIKARTEPSPPGVPGRVHAENSTMFSWRTASCSPDNVPFGEVAMAPPSLSAKPKKAPVKNKKASKDLLLTSLLGHTTASTAKPSMARQRLVEEERERVIEAYRQLKKRKQQQQTKTASFKP